MGRKARPKIPRTLRQVDLRGRLRVGGAASLNEASELFGWMARSVTKTAACLTEGIRAMLNHSRFVIENALSGPVILNIEPECAHFPLASGETVTVQDTFEKEPVTLKIESD